MSIINNDKKNCNTAFSYVVGTHLQYTIVFNLNHKTYCGAEHFLIDGGHLLLAMTGHYESYFPNCNPTKTIDLETYQNSSNIDYYIDVSAMLIHD